MLISLIIAYTYLFLRKVFKFVVQYFVQIFVLTILILNILIAIIFACRPSWFSRDYNDDIITIYGSGVEVPEVSEEK
jgi:hypothetical protein